MHSNVDSFFLTGYDSLCNKHALSEFASMPGNNGFKSIQFSQIEMSLSRTRKPEEETLKFSRSTEQINGEKK